MEIKMKRFCFAAALALFASPALAERLEVLCEESALINNGTATLCAPFALYTFRSDGPEVEYFLTMRAPDSHCATVVYTVYDFEGSAQRAFSNQLAPGQAENVVIGRGFPAGDARVWIGGMGIVGDCNVGQMHSWAVEVSAAPVP
jgi:hypothetical protein